MEAEISHPLLLDQLQDHFGSDVPPALIEFLLSVDRSYHEGDALRDRMRRSVSLALQKLMAVSGQPLGLRPPDMGEEIRLATQLLSRDLNSLSTSVARTTSGLMPPSSQRRRVFTVLCVVEGGLLRLVERVLSARGYQVLEATTGAEARELMAAHPGLVDLLLLDDNLPDVAWAPLYSDLKRQVSGPAILLCNDPARQDDTGGPMRLRKPFSIEELADRVQESLAGSSRGR